MQLPKIKKPTFKKPDFSKIKSKFRRPDTTEAKNFMSVKSKGNLRLSLVLARRELSNYFSTPVSYIILTLFVVIVAIILFAAFSYLKFGTADLGQLFTAISFAFIIIIPALTMGSISREKQSGTIEFLLTQPITEFQVLIGKFMAYAFLVLLMLLLTIPLAFTINLASPLDFGQAAMQYIGGFILGLCFVSIGIAVSSFFKNEIASLLTSLFISVLFIITGTQFFNLFPIEFQSLINKFSLLTHFQSISRGVFDIRDILYFAAFIIVFLSIAYYKLLSEKYPSKDRYLDYSRVFLCAILIVTLLIGYFGQFIPGRIDATSNQRYTLSGATINLLNKLDKNFDITLYSSGNLPQDFQPILRDVEDILRDYAFASNGKVVVTQKDPSADNIAKDEATAAGIKENIFAVNNSDSSQQVAGYFGLTFGYGGTKDFMNLSSDVTSQLEFQLTKKIKKVSGIDRFKIDFIANNVKQARSSTYTQFNTDLAELFDVTDLTLDSSVKEIPADVKAVVLAGPNQKFEDSQLAVLKNYYNNGGSIFLLTDPIDIDPSGAPQKIDNSLSDMFKENGVIVNQDLVYDMTNNNQIQAGTGLFPIIINYPFWMISKQTAEGADVNKGVGTLTELWGSSISLDSSKFGSSKVNRIYETSDESNFQTLPDVSIQIDQKFVAKDSDKKQTVAASIENEKGGRAVIVGDSDLLSDDVLSALNGRPGSQDSLSVAFGISSIEWLTKDAALSSIKIKNRIADSLNVDAEKSALIIGVGIVFPIVLFVSIGGFRFYMRKKEAENVYEYDTED
ncbi:MAG: Gldg family protein [Candidatus Dojkabacteria bacterium]